MNEAAPKTRRTNRAAAGRRGLTATLLLLAAPVALLWGGPGGDDQARAQEAPSGEAAQTWELVTWAPEDCAACHDERKLPALNAPHRRAGLDCGSCHHVTDDNPHWETGESPETSCSSCHGDVAARFELNESHRLHEGIVGCSSCHDPHDTLRTGVGTLGGFERVCLDCHTDKGGPFVFEHGASRVDGCVACHEPHGSPNRHLLTFQDTGALCYSCHPSVPQFHFGFNPTAPPRFGLQTQCTNCHSSIHGSNFDPFFLQ